MADTAIFDVDGTLVETNYQHALASGPNSPVPRERLALYADVLGA